MDAECSVDIDFSWNQTENLVEFRVAIRLTSFFHPFLPFRETCFVMQPFRQGTSCIGGGAPYFMMRSIIAPDHSNVILHEGD